MYTSKCCSPVWPHLAQPGLIPSLACASGCYNLVRMAPRTPARPLSRPSPHVWQQVLQLSYPTLRPNLSLCQQLRRPVRMPSRPTHDTDSGKLLRTPTWLASRPGSHVFWGFCDASPSSHTYQQVLQPSKGIPKDPLPGLFPALVLVHDSMAHSQPLMLASEYCSLIGVTPKNLPEHSKIWPL